MRRPAALIALALFIISSVSLAKTPTPAPAPAPAAAPGPATPAAPAKAEEENLLSNTGDNKKAGDDDNSFAVALSSLGVEIVWSGYGDLTLSANSNSGVTFNLSHFNPIMGARIGDSLRAELELEIEDGGGGGIGAEYGFIEYSPSPLFALRMGKMLVPIGRFNAELHPSFRWNQISRPKVFRNIMPAAWSEVGMEVRGSWQPDSAFNLGWTVGAFNGLGYEAADDPSLNEEPFREMRDNLLDNNIDKGIAARLETRILPGRDIGDITLGLSGYTGATDPAGSMRYSVVDIDLQLKILALVIRGEYIQNFYGADKQGLRPWERGSYLQVFMELGDFKPCLRWDNLFARPYLGPPESSNIFVASLMYSPRPYVSLRIEISQEFLEGFAFKRGALGGGLMLAFSF